MMTTPPSTPRGSGEPDGTRATATSAEPSRTVDSYRLLQRLGEGGMGEVWIAEQFHPVRRQVAIKIVKAGMDTARVIARFEAERQALALMDHPSIAKVFDGGTTPEGRPYFAMEYVRGEPITNHCDRHRLPVRERLELFIQLCEGVQHAHQKGIIHRDLKPSNVLVAVVDDRPVPRIIDFGIAKAIAQPLTERSLFTEVGTFIGTPEYMSPEQAEMSPLDVDTRSDVYSLGVVLYELLAGTLPFDMEHLHQAGLDELRRTIREKDPPRPSKQIIQRGAASSQAAENRDIGAAKLVSLLRGDLDWITMKALEKDRTRRYATANALAQDVRRHLNDEPVSASPPGAAYRTRKFVRRHRVGVTAVVALATLLVTFSAVMTVQARRIARERDRANQEAVAAKQVSDFLVDLFNVSDPSEARGHALTAREILANGARRLEGSLRDQPRVQARLEGTIGAVYTSLGLYSDAQPLLEKALHTQKRVFGDDSRETLATGHQLANLYWYQRNFQAAEPLYRDVVHRLTRVLGGEHPETLKASGSLASLYMAQKRFGEAERLDRDTLETMRRVLGPDHPDTLASQENLQTIYFRQGRYAEAEPIALAVLEARRRVSGEDHPETLIAMHNVATLHEALGRYGEAEALYVRTIDAMRRVLGEDHQFTARARARLGKMYASKRRYDEAESLVLAGYQSCLRTLGAEHKITQEIASQLVQLYEVWGHAEKAREWRGKVTQQTAPQR